MITTLIYRRDEVALCQIEHWHRREGRILSVRYTRIHVRVLLLTHDKAL